jgi:hypothetical protein
MEIIKAPQKLKIGLLYDPAPRVLVTYPKESKSSHYIDTCVSMFTILLLM